MNSELFDVWGNARDWASWSHLFKMHLSCLGLVSCSCICVFYLESSEGTQLAQLQWLIARWLQHPFVYWYGRWHSLSRLCSFSEQSSGSSSACHVISTHPEQPFGILIRPAICIWTSALHLLLALQNDVPSFTSALVMSVSVTLLYISSFPGKKFQISSPSFLHITLFLTQY